MVVGGVKIRFIAVLAINVSVNPWICFCGADARGVKDGVVFGIHVEIEPYDAVTPVNGFQGFRIKACGAVVMSVEFVTGSGTDVFSGSVGVAVAWIMAQVKCDDFLAALGSGGDVFIVAHSCVFRAIEGIGVARADVLCFLFIFGLVDRDGGGDGL